MSQEEEHRLLRVSETGNNFTEKTVLVFETYDTLAPQEYMEKKRLQRKKHLDLWRSNSITLNRSNSSRSQSVSPLEQQYSTAIYDQQPNIVNSYAQTTTTDGATPTKYGDSCSLPIEKHFSSEILSSTTIPSIQKENITTTETVQPQSLPPPSILASSPLIPPASSNNDTLSSKSQPIQQSPQSKKIDSIRGIILGIFMFYLVMFYLVMF